ncbi:MAG TPA: hypothetical protein VK753_08400 [Xanthomonadaceae bacterium]|nr:hypothetical protein [Xanthomonadaceae bacterium]
MRRLMLALSIASFIAAPAAFAHNHHFGAAHVSSHRGHSRGNDAESNAANQGAFDPSDRSRTVADSGRSRHHERVPDEEELEQPEQ